MKNKNYKLLLGSAMLAGVVMISTSLYLHNTVKYKQRTAENSEKEESEEAAGAAKWLFDIQKNPLTGKIDVMDVLRANEEVERMKNLKSVNSGLGLEWSELGPDNVGGRTRAILIDKTDATGNKMYAGSVSGGLWVSTNAGSTWKNVAGFDQQPNLAITCITQAADGAIYAGTGEDLYYFTGDGAAGILGMGIYKSTDGVNFSLLTSTIPLVLNSSSPTTSTKFIGVNNIAADPTNANRIYAATSYGLQMTDDGGATWKHAILNGNGSNNTVRTTDVDVASDGTVLAALQGKLYRSANGDQGTFTIVSGTGLPTSSGRIEFAISPSDANYMYALSESGESLQGVFQSINKGLDWTKIGNGGSTQFDPISQGSYALAIAVFAGDKTKIIIGGLDTWIWKQGSTTGVGQWSKTSNWTGGGSYVHADIHTFKFSPFNSNLFYVGCDGGVFRAYDFGTGLGFQAVNNGYNVTQFYSIAAETDDTYARAFMAGAQDNGTQYVSGYGNTPKNANEISGGDGAECEISFLNPAVSFTTLYYGSLARHSSKGGAGNGFYSNRVTNMFPNLGNSGASFVTPISLYETKTATNSPDSVVFINGKEGQIGATGDGATRHYVGYLNLPQASATIVPDSIFVKAGLQTMKDDGSGAFSGTGVSTATGETSSIDYATGRFDIYFKTAPNFGETVNITFSVMYSIGSKISITRPQYVYPLIVTATSTINPSDTVSFYDPFQAKLAVGFTGAVFMTKGALDFSGTPEWVDLGSVSGTVEELAWSADGDVLYAGTDNGNLYRFSNVAAVVDSANGDVASSGTVVVKKQIAGFSGNFITGLSVDPNDANKLAVSLGGYGTSPATHVYYSTTAATCLASTSTTNFAGKQGTGATKLPSMPVYTALIESTNNKRVIVGTEHGVYSTADITVATPVWEIDNGSTGLMPNVPVFKLRQERRAGTEVYNPYVIYAGTHGRGAWKTDKYKSPVTVGIAEPTKSNPSTIQESGIRVYPNPMVDKGTIEFDLGSSTDVIVSIYSIRGELVKTMNQGKLQAGNHKIALSTEELAKGTYFISVDGSGVHANTKFIVSK